MIDDASCPRPTVAADCPPPWEIATGPDALEAVGAASVRHGVKSLKLRAKAMEQGFLPVGARFDAKMASTLWDQMAALCLAERAVGGPKATLAARRALAGKESPDHAAQRLGIRVESLRGRARTLTGSKAARAPALWDALAAEIGKRGPL